MSADRLAPLVEIISGAFPDLASAVFTLCDMGWDSVAVDVDDALIFKFPRNDAALTRLKREVGVVNWIRPRVRLAAPDMQSFDSPRFFTRHAKLKGDHLTPDIYEGLSQRAQQMIAEQLAGFYVDLHALNDHDFADAGAVAIEPWLGMEELARRALPLLPDALRPGAQAALEAYANLPPDPLGDTFGYFDGHGWNMAFDVHRERLNGVYDFGDSGFGPLHQEFLYSSLISFDLTRRIVDSYEALSGVELDRNRIRLLTGVHRLWELAMNEAEPSLLSSGIARVGAWAASPSC